MDQIERDKSPDVIPRMLSSMDAEYLVEPKARCGQSPNASSNVNRNQRDEGSQPKDIRP